MAKLVKKGSRGAKGEVELQDHPSAKPVEGIAEIGFDVSAPEPAAATKSKYPLVEGPAIAKLADRIIELGEKFDAVADPFKAAKMEMTELAMPQFFEKNRGRVEAPSSMIAQIGRHSTGSRAGADQRPEGGNGEARRQPRARGQGANPAQA
jgi:hypothetical protein